jgi:hypothetical protein
LVHSHSAVLALGHSSRNYFKTWSLNRLDRPSALVSNEEMLITRVLNGEGLVAEVVAVVDHVIRQQV